MISRLWPPSPSAPGFDLVTRWRELLDVDPIAAAVRWGAESLDRRELDRRAAALAAKLVAVGAGPGVVIGVLLPRSVDLVVAQLGCWYAGSAFCTIDPALPAARIAEMVDVVGLHWVLVDPADPGPLPLSVTCIPVRVESTVDVDPEALSAVTAPGRAVCGADLAYVIFTSGSTGRPKAVAVEHHTLSVIVAAWQLRYDLAEHADRVLQVAATSFDVAVADLARTISGGGCLVLPTADELADPHRLVGLMRREQVSYLEITPSLMAALAAGLGDVPALPALRCLVVGGERMDPEHVRVGWQLLGPNGRLFNTYGITEATIDSTVAELARTDPTEPLVRLGEPFAGTTLTVRDPELLEVAAGEAYLGGGGVARGYLGDPATTADRFVPDPNGAPGARMFRSGDRLQRRSAGSWVHLGRLDRQVKVGGVRVDLEEVERRLLAVAGVGAGAVVVTTDQQMVAHLVPLMGALAPVTEHTVRNALAERLPAALVPHRVMVRTRLPVTASGKIDRAALEAEGLLDAGTAVPPPPSTDPSPAGDAQAISALMADLLSIEPDPDADFFARGGSSLLATVLIGRLRHELGLALTTTGDLWRHPTPTALALVCVPAAALRRAQDPVRAPLSSAQRRMWLAAQLHPDDPAGTVCVRLQLDGEIDVTVLSQAVDELVRRHPALRTVVEVDEQGEPYAVAAEPNAGTLQIRLDANAADPVRASWDLARGPLFRAVLTWRATGGWLDLAGSHLVLDGESVRILLSDLEAILWGRAQPHPAASPFDVAAADALDPADLRYWQRQLDAAPVPLTAPAADPPAFGQHRRTLPADVVAQVQVRAAGLGTSSFVLLLAAWCVVQRGWQGRSDVVVGVPFGDRRLPESEGVVGFFVDTVAIRVEVAQDGAVDALIHSVHEVVGEARRHRSAPYDQVLHALGRSGGEAPLFGSWFNHLGPADVAPEFPGLRSRMVDPPVLGGQFDVNLYLEEHGATLRLDLVVGAQGPDDAHAAALIDQYLALVIAWSAGAVLSPRLSDPPTTEPAHAHAALPTQDALRQRLLSALQVKEPSRVMIEAPGRRVVAHQLAGRLVDLSRSLAAAGVPPGELVGIVAERGVGLAYALLALVSGGYGFCVIDAGHPEPWRQAQLAVARPRAVLSIARDGDLTDLTVSDEGRAGADYVQFTSGSTGLPRAVLGGYRQLAAALDGYQRLAALRRGDRVAVLAGLGHDPLLRDVLAPILAGAQLVIPPGGLLQSPPALVDWLADQQITVAHLTPVLLRALAAAADQPLPQLRLVVSGGDTLHPVDVSAAAELAPAGVLVNAYGATETPQIAAYGASDPARPGRGFSVPVRDEGTASSVLVLRPDGSPTAAGEVGEVVVESPVLALGYADGPVDTFAAGRCSKCRRFSTGDRARRLADGAVELLGRTGDEVSVGAQRVHLGAVSALLRRELPVADVATLAVAGESGDTRLAVFVVPGPEPLDAVTVRRHLRRVAPSAYVPAFVVLVDQIPRNAHGKPDYRALSERLRTHPPATAATAAAGPATDLAGVVTEVYAQVLGLTEVPGEANFFELGGTSLAMSRVVHLLELRLGLRLPPLLLFEHPSVDALAASLQPAASGARPEPGRRPRQCGPGPRTATSDARRRAEVRRAIRQAGPELIGGSTTREGPR